MLFLIFSVGYFSPIVPVHPKRISLDKTFFGISSSSICFLDNFNDSSSAISFNPLYPSVPVNAFAFLVLISRDLIFLLFYLYSYLDF